MIVNPKIYIPNAATKKETGIPKAVINATLALRNKYNDINNKNNPISMKCLAHQMGDISTILSYEFHQDFIDMKNVNDRLHNEHPATKIYNFVICQWFMISEPKQDIFLKMFLSIKDKLDILININKKDKDYFHKVISIMGPSGFTKVVMDNLTDKIKILPCDFFCGGMGKFQKQQILM